MTVTCCAGEGELLAAGPTRTIVKVPGEAADGRLGVVEMHISAGWEGPPPHVHKVVEHVWYVLSGTVELTLGEQVERYDAGACVYVPAGTPHRFSTSGCPDAVILQIDTPQALDGYFRDLVEAFPAGRPVDPVMVGEIMRRHDTYPIGA